MRLPEAEGHSAPRPKFRRLNGSCQVVCRPAKDLGGSCGGSCSWAGGGYYYYYYYYYYHCYFYYYYYYCYFYCCYYYYYYYY